ncbi:DUF484 family protein [Massilia yuzhufengensis]|uniref:DUF484 domain-containing protein n=1 Tax=Massilia yuzhufengensis TaxID=1164594 RepID=A0A1I1DS75_9BURK|nr:DUF484 family protein [Massilia yuzhufengensis]SFB77242.1 hypothetical protein SAMN05216204_101344 [Massilia yuzhufengensis]
MTTDTLDASAVAQYLIDHPQFFEEHAGLLGEVKLSSPLTGRAVSLQERQMEVMRDKYRVLELRLAELTRRAEENHAIANRFHAWNQALLKSDGAAAMARDLVDALRSEFMVPQVTLRLWNLAPEHAGEWFASDVSDDARLFASGLRAPYCGMNNDFEAVRWLDDPAAVRSTVLMPLGLEGKTFGLLVLGAPDADRFTSTMATDFLAHIAATASTALAPLRA